MALVVPTTPKGLKTRALLIAAGRQVFARSGYVDLRMSDVAVEANVSTGALYRYFENKEDLFASVIADVHEEMFQASGGLQPDFKAQPFEALYQANLGYLTHYRANRDVMRAFIEATTVDERFRAIWWEMRNRHVDRFVHALAKHHGITEVGGASARILTEAMAAMVEQCSYIWYARHEGDGELVALQEAAMAVTGIWYKTFFVAMPPR